jgi:hypothetical protein
LTLHFFVHFPVCREQLWNCKKVGIYSLLTPLPSLVGNGYIIYLSLLIPTRLNGTATAIGTTHGISWIFALQFFFLWTILEETLLGSFHWWSNEEIPILTLMVRSSLHRTRSFQAAAVQKPLIFPMRTCLLLFSMSSGPMETGAGDYETSGSVLSNRHLGILIFPLWGKWFYRNV